METIYFIIGLIIGSVAAWFIVTVVTKSKTVSKTVFDSVSEKLSIINTDLSIERQKAKDLMGNLAISESNLKQKSGEVTILTGAVAAKSTHITELEKQLKNCGDAIVADKQAIREHQTNIQALERDLGILKANYNTAIQTIKINQDDIRQLKNDLQQKTNEFNEANKSIAELTATNKSLQEKLDTQKTEIEDTKKKFNIEFENIATKILDDKTKKFTDLNKTNLETILHPLGNEIKDFKKKVEEVYDKESKERFSLGREVEKLVLANQKISEEANNLTNALTTKGKTQGDWGEMILESILEKSGLARDQHYFLQNYLKDKNGEFLLNEHGERMKPDAIVSYPDNRKVIVDSKVSLTAFNRYTSATNKEEEKKFLSEHLRSIYGHIDDLSSKNYQDFAPSLDFVMMFVPVEPAYLISIHSDQDLWEYAYKKRILLTSPSNLIVALKMIVDLWMKDTQNKNHQEIVDRGGKLYDKFAMVLESVEDIGANLKATQKSYNTVISRLSEGNDNVLKQVEKLKKLGVKAKKNLLTPDSLPLLDTTNDNNG
ncbi:MULTISPECIES: DNA recombination protein RmuC [Chitinophagaceae]